ncbi:MAG TPA: hypothetical protein VD931_16920 [Baekduia sp.]|nr:hypothetical protein [Baekduia sp.]
MTATAPELTPAEVLDREERGRRRAGVAAIAGGLLLLAAALLTAVANRDRPSVYLSEALREASGQDIGRTALLGERVENLSDEAAAYLGSAVATAAGWALTGLALAFLLAAARARRPETPRFTAGLLLAGAVGVGLSSLLVYGGLVVEAKSWIDASDQTSETARDVFQQPVVYAGQLLGVLGTLALAMAFTFTALNAMRAGLLTRFMGILGIITGVLLIFPIGVGLPIVQTFWLVALGLLVLGALPGGRPPAWSAGIAVPWPSQQEQRERRERGGGGRAPKPPEPEPEAPRTGEPSPATSSKKKRKRRG